MAKTPLDKKKLPDSLSNRDKLFEVWEGSGGHFEPGGGPRPPKKKQPGFGGPVVPLIEVDDEDETDTKG